jgi:hypothetical protein
MSVADIRYSGAAYAFKDREVFEGGVGVCTGLDARRVIGQGQGGNIFFAGIGKVNVYLYRDGVGGAAVWRGGEVGGKIRDTVEDRRRTAEGNRNDVDRGSPVSCGNSVVCRVREVPRRAGSGANACPRVGNRGDKVRYIRAVRDGNGDGFGVLVNNA